MLSEKQKLGEELKLLEESFVLEVITKEELESAKQRIESKLKELEKVEENPETEPVEEETKEKPKEEDVREDVTEQAKEEPFKEEIEAKKENTFTIKEETKEQKEEIEPEIKKEVEQISEPAREGVKEEVEAKEEITFTVKEGTKKEGTEPEIKKEEPEIQIKELTKEAEVERAEETQKRLEEIKEEKEPEVEDAGKSEIIGSKTTGKLKISSTDSVGSSTTDVVSGTPSVGKPAEEVKEEEDEKEEAVNHIGNHEIAVEEEKKSKKIWIYVAIMVILGFVSGYFFFSGGGDDSMVDVDKTAILIACSSDKECVKEGSIGICNDPGTEDSECSYIEDVKIKLTVLNNDCFNCGTGRVMSILNGLFLNLDTESIDFETEEGKEIASKFGITALPAYIFNSSVKDAYNYKKISNAFNVVDDMFALKNTVANANYYLDRKEIPNKLDLFFKSEQPASKKAEENLEEFLDAFGNVEFKKHDSTSQLAKQLGINSFPAFLINNKIKFGGVQAADTIKENFCQMNDAEACGLELAKSLA